MSEAKDFLGKSIQVGDAICYPVRRASSMWLNRLTVLAVQNTPRGAWIGGTNAAGRWVTIHNLKNCVVVN